MNWYALNEKIKPHRVLISNFNFLSIFQFAQLIFPFITYPYLIRILGKELFGVIVFASAITAYFVLFINFGFNISEIKEISIYRNNRSKLSEILSSVLTIKIVLALFSIFILLSFISLFDFFSKYSFLYLAYSGLMLDAAINPSFYFQGIEKMKFITIFSILSQMIFTILIFLLIRSPRQYNLVPLLTSIGNLSGSLAGLYIVFIHQGITFKFSPLKTIKKYLFESVPFFTSRLSSVFNQKTNVLLIGSFLGYNEVAYYDLAEKITNVMKIPFTILNQALYPNVSVTKNITLVKKFLKILLIFYIFNYLSIFLWGRQAVILLGSQKLLPAVNVLYLLALTAITELVVVFLGAPILLVSGFKKEYNLSIIYGSLFYCLLIAVLYIFNLMGLYQLVVCSVLSSCFILLYRFYYTRRYNLL
jgi:PST family polysaccharide transporter